MSVVRAVAGTLAGAILVISYLAAVTVLAAGTYLGVAKIIDAQVWPGIVTLFLTAPAMAITQTVIGLVAIPFGALAEAGD